MTWTDSVGYLASLLVLTTFCMKTMLWLRTIAVCSNVAFVVYGLAEGIYPVLILHMVLLPLNVARCLQIVGLMRRSKLAANTGLPEWLQPFMKSERFQQGETLFQKGDRADNLYLITSGEVELPDMDLRLKAGEVFGEIGLFSVDCRRTQTVRAVRDLEVLWISGGELMKLCESNPGLSLYFLRLAASRLIFNASRPAEIVKARMIAGSGIVTQ